MDSGLDGVGSIQPDTNLFDIEILDSLVIVSMVVFLEERFSCSLDYEDLTEENLGSLAAITDLVMRKTS